MRVGVSILYSDLLMNALTPNLSNQQPSDGRRARSQRGRLAALEAMIDLLNDGHTPPSASQVAQRAGISVATLFRYFETLEDLRKYATQQCLERFAHLFEIPQVGMGTTEEKIAALVASRLDQSQAIGPIARLIRWRAFDAPEVRSTLAQQRQKQRQQLATHFAKEMNSLSLREEEDLLASLFALTSFEAWDQRTEDQQHSSKRIASSWEKTLAQLLAAP